MNNGAPGQQPAQGPPQGMVLFKPEMMRTLPPGFTAEERAKWETGLKALWLGMEQNPEDSPQYQEVKKKLQDFSRNLHHKLAIMRQQAASSGTNSNQSRPSQKILDHVNGFPFTYPANIQPGTPNATKWIQEAKNRYLKGLVTMDSATTQLTHLDAMVKKRNDEGKPLNPGEQKDYESKKEMASKRHAEAKLFVDKFRNGQAQARQQMTAAANTAQAQVQGGNENGNNAVRPQLNLNQPSNPQQQNTQTVNAAIEAARNQQMASRNPMQNNGQAPQSAVNNAPSHLPQHQGGPVQHIKQEAGVVPHINTQMGRAMQSSVINSPQSGMTGTPNSAMPMQNPMSSIPVPLSARSVPQSATSMQNPGSGIPLTHPQALQQAARTYSSGQTTGTPNVMGQHPSHSQFAPSRETPNSMTNKMPIPKNLPPGATAQPQPVIMPPSRPTMSGGANGTGMGMMSQPVLQQTPGYKLDGDTERILNKKKLDELVRQVTGGGDGLGGGEVLSPDVEEVCD